MDFLGMYPLFYVPEFGSAWLMGITGVIHMVASHTSVGAALLFAFLAYKAQKENRDDLYVYMKKYGMFLLIFSYVIGSITGPGIWYTATAASPRGISSLIHNFVWVWSSEWVFFVYEVMGVFALIYFMDKIDRKTHLKLTYTFAIASIGTLALIIGIISFMMWPGTETYYATGSSSDAFFGLNTFPHMFLRIGFMIMLSGIIGMIIAAAMRKENPELADELMKKLGWVSFAGSFITVFFFVWYVNTLPENAKVLLGMVKDSIIQNRIILAVLFSLYFMIAIVKPRWINTAVAVTMMFVISIVGVWPGEKLRETMRKPWVAGQYMYSNQIIGRDVPGKGIKEEVSRLSEHGLLKLNPWVPERLRTITDENRLEVGKLLTRIACSNCHSLEADGKYRPLIPLAAPMGKEGLADYMKNVIGTGSSAYMPQISLPDAEYEVMAEYIVNQAKEKE